MNVETLHTIASVIVIAFGAVVAVFNFASPWMLKRWPETTVRLGRLLVDLRNLPARVVPAVVVVETTHTETQTTKDTVTDGTSPSVLPPKEPTSSGH